MVVSKPLVSGKVHPAPTWITFPEGGAQQRTRYPVNFGDIGTVYISKGPDLSLRDPEMTNSQITVQLEDAVVEPGGIRSSGCSGIKYSHCYTRVFDSIYKCASIFCRLPLAMLYGCAFVFTILQHVWIVTPLLKVFENCCSLIRRFVRHFLCKIGVTCERGGNLILAFTPKSNMKIKKPLERRKNGKVRFDDNVRMKTIPARESNGYADNCCKHSRVSKLWLVEPNTTQVRPTTAKSGAGKGDKDN